MRNHEEAVEKTKSECRHGKEIHCRDDFTMVAQKGHPSLRRLRIPRGLSHPSQHRTLRYIEAQHLQFAMNARRAPGGVLGDHAEDQFTQFLADAFSSSAVTMPREPRPIRLESRLMPANYGVRLDENQCPLPSRPDPLQHHPEQFVRGGKPRLRMLLLQYGELLAKCQVFQQQISARGAGLSDQDKQELQRTEHTPVVAE